MRAIDNASRTWCQGALALMFHSLFLACNLLFTEAISVLVIILCTYNHIRMYVCAHTLKYGAVIYSMHPISTSLFHSVFQMSTD